jgi:hypothetical protein
MSERGTSEGQRGNSAHVNWPAGFKALHVADCGGRALMSISFWEDKVAARKSAELARNWVSQSAIGILPFPPELTEGDTVIDIGQA